MIANSVICNGSIRCLNKIYAKDLALTGSMSVPSLTVSGTSTLSGAVTMSSTATIAGRLTVTKGTDISLTANSDPCIVVGPMSGIHLEIDANEIMAKSNNTTGKTSLHLNLEGGSVYLSSSSIYAAETTFYTPNIQSTGTIVAENANIINTLRATKFDLQTVSQTGGSLYVSPTIRFPNSGTSVTVTAGNPATIKIIDAAAITSTTMAGIVWTVNSKVKVSGTIGGKTTGVMEGTITAIDVSNGHYITISCSGGAASSLVSGNYGSGEIKDLTVACFELYSTTSQKTFRVGIWLNSYDIYSSANINGENKAALSAIRIYGGTDDLPVACLGNLQQAGLGQVNGENVGGWGLFTKRGYFQGMIVSTSGKIGGWTLDSNSLKNGTIGSSGSALVCTGTSTSYNIGGSGSIPGWTFASGSTWGVTSSGAMYAASGKIGGWDITTQSIRRRIDKQYEVFLWAPTGTPATTDYAFGIGVLNTSNAITSYPFGVKYDGSINSTKGTIAGWNISSTTFYKIISGYKPYLYAPGSPGTGNSFIGLATLDANNNETGYPFRVNYDGTLTATKANITGAINANSGRIGNVNISYNDTANQSKTSANGGHYYAYGLWSHASDTNYDYEAGLKADTGSTATMFYIRRQPKNQAWNNTTNSAWMWYVRQDGYMYSISGSIGGWTIDGTSGLKNNDSTIFLAPAQKSVTMTIFGKSYTFANSLARFGNTLISSGGINTEQLDAKKIYIRETKTVDNASKDVTGCISCDTYITIDGGNYHVYAKSGNDKYDVIDSCYMANDMWGRMKFTVENTNVNVWGPANHLTLHSDGEIYVSKSAQTFGLFSLFNSSVKKKTATINSTTTLTSGVLYIAFIYHADTANSNGVYMFRGGSNNIWPIKTGSNLTLQISGGTNFYWNSSSGSPTCYLFYN